MSNGHVPRIGRTWRTGPQTSCRSAFQIRAVPLQGLVATVPEYDAVVVAQRYVDVFEFQPGITHVEQDVL